MVLEIGVYGGAIPFAVALALVYLASRFVPPIVFERIAMAGAFAAAFFVGWVLLPEDWTPLSPERPWHWLPYVGLLAAVVSANGFGPVRRSLTYAWRVAANLLTAGLTAWLIAPTWPNLEPPRYVYVLLLGGGLFALITLLDALPDHVFGRLFPFLLFTAASTTAVVIALPVSMQYGQVAGVSAAALFGCGVGGLLGTRGPVPRGLIPVYGVLVGCIAFTGSIELEPPKYAILLAPLAPLALWACAYGPIAQLSDRKAIAIQFAVVLLPLAVVAAWILLGGEPDYPEYDY